MFKSVFLAVVLTIVSSGFAESLVISSTGERQLTLEWNSPEITTTSENLYTHIWFTDSKYPQTVGKPAIPYKEFIIGTPDQGLISWDVTILETEQISDVNPFPVTAAGHDKNGISEYIFRIDEDDYRFQPENLIVISPIEYFRDLPIRRIQFYPISYDPQTSSLTVIKRATISFLFRSEQSGKPSTAPNGRLDELYNDIVLNAQQAKQWIKTPGRRSLLKTNQFTGPWYRIEINEDGLYKITRSTLTTAGIDVAAIDPRTIKIWSSGGQPLNANVNGSEHNHQGPKENSILVFGEDDGQFDTSDFILFYGKRIGGWDYDSADNDFEYIQHPYANKNYYWLTYGGDPGRRMESIPAPATGATVSDEFYLDRRHFESDQYNLLASGPDWYGHRFFGSGGNASFTHNLPVIDGSVFPARLRIKFKSGNGVSWADNDYYRYRFNIYLNPDVNTSPLINNATLISDSRSGGGGGSRIFERSFISSDYLTSGDNVLDIGYSGNLEECVAHLDWVEYYFPKPFAAEDNYLAFYSNSVGQIVSYQISNFNTQDFVIFDVSFQTDPIQISTDALPASGVLNMNLDLTDNRARRIIVAGLESNKIRTVGSLRAVNPSKNLLDPAMAADLIIITHPSFESYAEDIRSLRTQSTDPISSVVVNTQDIFFYFSSGVQDPVAIRNFLRYAYLNWTNPRPSYVLLFGDGHYDYRNIALPDTNRVIPFEIFNNKELNSRESDNFYADINFASNNFSSISPDLAIGRLPMESHLDARRMLEKLDNYQNASSQDGWQTVMTFVADDQNSGSGVTGEWIHQRQTEWLATLPEMNKFIKKKVYLSGFNSIPGGFGRVKPEANQAIIDQLNEGTLLINYVGHGSPTEWAHESVLNLTRDLNRIQNHGKLTFWIAATCDFGKYDDPRDPSFSEALIWQENAGAIGVLSSARLVFSGDNFNFNSRFLRNLFPNGNASRRLGEAMLLASYSGVNDQKYHLFADPSMYIADPRSFIRISNVSPDTLKALAKITVNAEVSATQTGGKMDNFNGGAFLIVNDARYDSVDTGGNEYYELIGPRIFKGEISVEDGELDGSFIVPKSIRYHPKNTGRITLYAWNENLTDQAMGFLDTLLFNGTEQNLSDDSGPDIDIYFEDQESFNNGDIIPRNPVLIAELSDESGINLTEEVGHSIEILIDEGRSQNITSFFSYERDSFSEGKLIYNLENLEPGRHSLMLKAWDNLNNPSTREIEFRISEESGLALADVVNYPNPFGDRTHFTFQMQSSGSLAEVTVKIYTVSGRLVTTLDNFPLPQPGFNYLPWDGRDDDGDLLANGVYIYKIILDDGNKRDEVIEKLVILR